MPVVPEELTLPPLLGDLAAIHVRVTRLRAEARATIEQTGQAILQTAKVIARSRANWSLARPDPLPEQLRG